MITLSNVNFGYASAKPLFQSLSLDLEAGHIYGLLGENGIGKTTLLKLIAGLVFPKSGQITTLRQNPQKRQPTLLEQFYFLAEDAYTPNTTPRTYARHYGGFYPDFDKSQFLNYLSQFQVEPDQKLEKMSLGQRKKMLISFALATNVPLLLMDEPTNGLDIPSKSVFRKLVAGIATPERCIIISTHQVRDLETLIDSVLIVKNRQVAYQKDLTTLTNTPDLESLFKEVIA